MKDKNSLTYQPRMCSLKIRRKYIRYAIGLYFAGMVELLAHSKRLKDIGCIF